MFGLGKKEEPKKEKTKIKTKLIFHGPLGKSKEAYEKFEKTGEGTCLVEECNYGCV